MKNRISMILVTCLLLMTCMRASASSPLDDTEQIKTTAYMLDGVTASGCEVRSGICAGQEWMVKDAIEKDGSWVAMLWTEDGEFLGYFEVLDTGGEPIRSGNVLDVWFETYEECHEWMVTTQGKCLVKYVWAVG